MKETENEIFANENIKGVPNADGTYIKETRICGIRGESSADFILPDYMGDVKRLLKSTSEVCIANKFAGGGEISFLLLVTYRVMYLDSDDNLTEAIFTSDYECAQKTEAGFIDADIESKVQNLSVRLQGPRKMCAKVSLISEIRMSEEAEIINLPDVSEAECKRKTVKIHKAKYLKFPEREFAEEIGRLEGISADEAEIIKCDAYISVKSVRKGEDTLTVSGDINAFTLIRLENDIIRAEKKIPFEENISISEKDAHSVFSVRGTLGSVSANANNAVNDSADAGVYTSVVMNFTVDLYAVCDENKEKTLISDAYVCGRKNECSYRNFVYNELLGVHNEKKRISLVSKRDETPIRNILDFDVCLKNIKYNTKDCDIELSGALEYNFIVCTMQPFEVKSVKGECDFSEIVRLPWQPDKQKVKINLIPCEISPGFDSENIYISMDISVSVLEEETKSEKILTELISEAYSEGNEKCVIVYYPKMGDSIWSVAKKYAVSPYDLIKTNELADFSDSETESIDGINKLVIIKNHKKSL